MKWNYRLIEYHFGLPLIKFSEIGSHHPDCRRCRSTFAKFELHFRAAGERSHVRIHYLCESCLREYASGPSSEEIRKAVDRLVHGVVKLHRGDGPDYIVCPNCDEKIATNESDESKWPHRNHRLDRSGTVVLRCPRLVA